MFLVFGLSPLLLFCSLFSKWKGKGSLAVNQNTSLTLACISGGDWSPWCRLRGRNKIIDFIRVYYLKGFLSMSCCCQSHRIRCDFPFAGIYSKYANRLSAFFSSQKQGSPLKDPPLTQSSLCLTLYSIIIFWQCKSSHLPPSLFPSVALPAPSQDCCYRICDDMWSPGYNHTHTQVPGTAAQLSKMSFS